MAGVTLSGRQWSLKGRSNAISCIHIYTVKELDSRAKHDQSPKKKTVGCMTEYFCAKVTPSG